MKRLLLPALALVLLMTLAQPAGAAIFTEYTSALTEMDDPGWVAGREFPDPPVGYSSARHLRDAGHVFWSEASDPRVTGKLMVQFDAEANWQVMRLHGTQTRYVQEEPGGEILGVWQESILGWYEPEVGSIIWRGQARGVSGVVEGLTRTFTVTPEDIYTETGRILEP